MSSARPQRRLVDSFGRVHSNLRVSVTDRCNIRCYYCMPESGVKFLPRDELLTFEELDRLIGVAASLGVDKIRLTGGEPLVRRDLPELIWMIRKRPGIKDLALTTNGILLADQAKELKDAGLDRLNISLDTLSDETFFKISRRNGLSDTLKGIEVAQRMGFAKIRLNAIAIAGLSETEIVPLAAFARDRQLEIRFIEFMPLDAEQNWDTDQVLNGARIRQILEQEFGTLRECDRPDPSQPATDFAYSDLPGVRVGFINPVSQPFCQTCNRLRVTAEGQIRNCLFSVREWDARDLLRSGANDEALADLLLASVGEKKAAHGIDQESFERPSRAMYQIGG